MPMPHRPQKQCVAPAIDPMVGPGNPPYRHPHLTGAHRTFIHHCLVALATSTSSRRTKSTPQIKIATVMLEQFRRNPVRSVSPMARRSARKAAPPRCGASGKRPDEAGGRHRETLRAGYILAQFLRLSAQPWHHHDLRRKPRPCAKCPPAERSGFRRNCSSRRGPQRGPWKGSARRRTG